MYQAKYQLNCVNRGDVRIRSHDHDRDDVHARGRGRDIRKSSSHRAHDGDDDHNLLQHSDQVLP